MAALEPGALILAGLGYFGFAWFDDLTGAGQVWVSRQGKGVTYTVEPVCYPDGDTRDALVWLGK